jgi:two-component system phosphate regulon sensor histidine kinase PhoR
MIFANKTHNILLVLYGIIVCLAAWGLVPLKSETESSQILWITMGAVAALGAMLEILLHLRTSSALRQVKTQIERMRQNNQVGLVMIEDHWPVEGLTGILNSYLTLIRSQIDQYIREGKESDLLMKAVDSEKSNIEAILSSISDGVIVVNSFHELTIANPQAEKLFNFQTKNAKGKPIEDVISDPVILAMLNPDRREDSKPIVREYKMDAPPGSEEKYFLITISPVYTRNKELWAVAMTLRDVTHEQKLTQMKNDFINQVCHELRTPLSGIKAYVELLLTGDAKTTASRNDFYRIIQMETDRLDRFIGNMLNISRIESGCLSAQYANLDLREELKESLELAQSLADEKSIQLTHQIPSESFQIIADRDLFRQVVLNLLSNAIKYTPTGGKVHLETGHDEAKKIYSVTVRDTGIGIDKKDLNKIFDKYYRTENGKDISTGTGLGLTLVRRVVEHIYKGRIKVESQMGEGSSFTITLPVNPHAVDEVMDTELVEVSAGA